MSARSRSSPPPAKQDLDTVVNWPLIWACAALVVVPAVVVAGLAGYSFLTAPPTLELLVQLDDLSAPRRAPAARPTILTGSAPAEEPEQIEEMPAVKVVRTEAPPPPAELPVKAVVKAPPRDPPGVAKAQAPEKALRVPPRRQRASEAELLAGLFKGTPELDILDSKTVPEKLKKAHKDSTDKDPAAGLLAYLKGRPDLEGLPLRLGARCRSDKESVKVLALLSRDLRRGLLRSRLSTPPPAEDLAPSYAYAREVIALMSKEKSWCVEAGVGGLEQILQTEPPVLRQGLVAMLKATKGQRATEALAARAVFDPSLAVRRDALEALKERKPDEARPVFLAALRYPWAPAADHAAEALVALEDVQAVPQLDKMLALPDPSAPRKDADGNWYRKELVRVNHMRNCLLCHAPSFDTADPVRGLMPVPGEPIPVVYYASKRGDFVRADVTYLKQDFSVMHPVEKAKPWPDVQRFDYFVRERKLSAAEAEKLTGDTTDAGKGVKVVYPQKEAVLFALAELTAGSKRARK